MCAEGPAAASSPDLRLCEPNDLEDVATILAEAPEAASWSREALENALQRQPNLFLIAAIENHAVGFSLGRRIADEAEILNIAVRRDHRRHGIGMALLRKLLETLQREQVSQVFLEVRESNSAAIAFYEHLGFARAGRRPGYYREPNEAALVLRAPICSNL